MDVLQTGRIWLRLFRGLVSDASAVSVAIFNPPCSSTYSRFKLIANSKAIAVIINDVFQRIRGRTAEVYHVLSVKTIDLAADLRNVVEAGNALRNKSLQFELGSLIDLVLEIISEIEDNCRSSSRQS